MPGGESLLMAAKAPWARARRFAKWEEVEKEGVNHRPNYLISFLGAKVSPSRSIGESEGGARSHWARQWMSSVFGTENPTPRGWPIAFRWA